MCELRDYKAVLSPTGDYASASLAAFSERALSTSLANFALKIIGSFVKGLMPLCALVAGFLTATNLAKPGIRTDPFS